MRAGQDAHERRFTGAVAADESDDLSGMEIDRDIADGMHPTEGDVDVAHLDQRGGSGFRHRRSSVRSIGAPTRRAGG